MYLENMLKQNPRTLRTALELHQAGRIPPNTWVVDLDTVAANARALGSEADRLGLRTYLMSKQHNRNPYINALAMKTGLNKLAAVDATCALHAVRFGLPLGHVGHLNQIPRRLMPALLRAAPEAWTVYSVEHARFIDDEARKLDLVQDLLLRVWTKGDVFFTGQEGGFPLEGLAAVCKAINRLANVRIVGVTGFPCVKYNETEAEKLALTVNAGTIMLAAQAMKDAGIDVSQVNMSGNTSTLTMEMLKKGGATHVEPGNALLGTTPSNAFNTVMKEQTAFAYVSEITHMFGGRAYALGGGVFHENYSKTIKALVGSAWAETKDNAVDYEWEVHQDIDYHMQFKVPAGKKMAIGDSVVLAYRTQMHMTRSYLAPVSGISGHRPLRVHYLFDNACNALDEEFNPVHPSVVKADIDRLLAFY